MSLPYFQKGINRRIGDEIGMTAILKYYKEKLGEKILYLDNNKFIQAKSFFPEGLVEFVDKEPEQFTWLHEHNIWIFTPFLRDLGIYTELRKEWMYKQDEKKDLDVVFVPLVGVDYNIIRNFDVKFCYDLMFEIYKKFPNSTMIIDRMKLSLFPMNYLKLPITVSSNIHETFINIQKSKIYIGGDTGTSHFAGACRHPKLLLLYGDNQKNAYKWESQRKQMGEILKEPKLLENPKYNWDSTPCCDPIRMEVLTLKDNKYPIDKIMESL